MAHKAQTLALSDEVLGTTLRDLIGLVTENTLTLNYTITVKWTEDGPQTFLFVDGDEYDVDHFMQWAWHTRPNGLVVRRGPGRMTEARDIIYDEPKTPVPANDHGADGLTSCGGGCCDPFPRGVSMLDPTDPERD